MGFEIKVGQCFKFCAFGYLSPNLQEAPMRLNLHARIEIAVVAVLLLGGCSDDRLSPERISNRAEAADFNARIAINATNDLDIRVQAIEQRLGM